MINSLLWLILNWWNNDGVKLNIPLKTLKIWLACFIWFCDKCMQSNLVALTFALKNKIYSSVLLKWCQNYGISFEHSGKATWTLHSRRGRFDGLEVRECKSGTSARDWFECKRGSSNSITAACVTRTRVELGNVPAGSGVPQGGVVLSWLGAPSRGTEVSIVMRSFDRMWSSRFSHSVILSNVM